MAVTAYLNYRLVTGADYASRPANASLRFSCDSTAELPSANLMDGDEAIAWDTGVYYVRQGGAWIVNSQATRGPKGDTGAAGAQGATGSQGAAGNTGTQGIQGIQGIQGPAGNDGVQGIQGIVGPQGVQGDTGDVGPRGFKGEKGDKGDAGVNAPAILPASLIAMWRPQSARVAKRQYTTLIHGR